MLAYLRHMLVFTKVVERQSISAAADELGLSKSVISQQLKSLEQALGVSLLNRTTRRQVLTPIGKDFYQQCAQMQAISNQAWEGAREAQREPVGSITISAPHALIESIVAPAMGELVSKFTKITPHVLAEDRRVDLLEDGIDLSIRVGKMPASEYKQRLLGQFSEVLCASEQYIFDAELRLDTFAQDQAQQLSCNYIANAWQGRRIRHKCFQQETEEVAELSFVANRFANSLPGVLAMAEAGAGVAFIPNFLFRDYQAQGKLRDLLPDYRFASVPVYSLHAFGQRSPKLVGLCIEAIKQKISGLC